MKNFTVHIFTQFRVKVTGIQAETMVEAISKAEANLSEEHLKSAEWAEGAADCYAVDPLLENGDVDYENTGWFGPDELPLIDGKTTIELKAQRADHAVMFMQELMDSVETLTGIVEVHGSRTLGDLMYLQQAILKDGFIDHYPNESKALEIVRTLPSSEKWVKFFRIEDIAPDASGLINNGADVGKAPGNDSFLLAAGWQLANGYTKTILPGAVFMRRLGGSGTKFASYDLTIVQAETGEWFPVHGMVKMHAVATPQEAADALMNHWHNLPDADKLASIATDRTT